MKNAWLVALVLVAAVRSADAQSLTRGPYLQQGSQTEVVVRWRTSSAANSRVRIGTALANPLPTVVSDAASTVEHVVKVTGLQPNTKYYYSVGSSSETLAGPDESHFFITAPSGAKPTRIWVIGDAGTKNSSQRAVRDAYYAFAGSRHTDLWLMLGDNAYLDGTDSDYQDAVFEMYPTLLRKSVVWPTFGNHDAVSANSSSQSGPYYDMFTLPRNGEAGGLASGTEAYYSFDYGNIHFMCLDSSESDRSSGGPMATWARNDAAATSREWIIAFWHHPPYSKGSHDTDTSSVFAQIRANLLPILEDAGVDLVLCGHSHVYERSFLLDGHYGLSTTLTAANKLDGGSGRDPSPYTKPPGLSSHAGTVYVVAGSSGQKDTGPLNHPAMFVSLSQLGSMVLDVSGGRLDAKFLRENGNVDDYFTILKGTPPPILPTVTVAATDAAAAEAGPDPGTFRVTRTGSTAAPLAVAYYMAGTAGLAIDYANVTSPITIPAGSDSVTLTITPTDDLTVEPNETAVFQLLEDPSYVVGAPSSAQVTIADNEDPADADGDGLPDAWEMQHFGNTTSQGAAGDPDNDDLANSREFERGTSPVDSDSDNDRMPDGWEDRFGLNPTNPGDAATDLDGDGFSNLKEHQGGSDPTSAASVPAARGGGSSGGGGGGCGATGLEVLALLALRRLRRPRQR